MKIQLEPLQISEWPIVVEWVNQYDQDFLVQWAGRTYTFPLTVEQMRQHYSKGINSLESGVYLYKIMDVTNNHPIGSIQICRFDTIHKEAVVGRFLLKDESYRGQGIGRHALRQLVRIGFETFHLNRIKLNVYDFNERAIKCYESVGFRKGKITEHAYQSSTGASWNNIEMILDREPAADS